MIEKPVGMRAFHYQILVKIITVTKNGVLPGIPCDIYGECLFVNWEERMCSKEITEAMNEQRNEQ